MDSMPYPTLVFLKNISQSVGFKSKRPKLHNLKFVIAYILCSIYFYTFKLYILICKTTAYRYLITALDE